MEVKALYVKNLPKNVTQEKVKELFKRHGEIIKVVIPPAKPGHEKSRFAFVHFAERAMAMKALKNTETYELGGQVLECSLAKPPADSKKSTESKSTPSRKSPLLSSAPSRPSYPMPNSFPPIPAPFVQPGMAMVPTVLPDGRFAYVLQQAHSPTQSPHQHHGGADRGRSGGSGGPNFSPRGRSGGIDDRSFSPRSRSGGNGVAARPGQRYRPY